MTNRLSGVMQMKKISALFILLFFVFSYPRDCTVDSLKNEIRKIEIQRDYLENLERHLLGDSTVNIWKIDHENQKLLTDKK